MPSAATRSRGRSSSAAATLERAARRYHVPLWILVGVYGLETTFGANVNVSTAGAKGPFQFIDSTAAAYHVNVASFDSSAMGAAHYLADLHRQYGSWDAAVSHYSAGGYDLAAVRSKAQSAPASIPLPPLPGFPKSLGPGGIPLPDLGGPGGLPTLGGLLNFPSQILDTFSAMLALLKLLTSIEFWIRAGEVLAGLILLHMGLKGLSGDYAGATGNAAGSVKKGAEAAAAIAVVK